MKAWRMYGVGDMRLDEVPVPDVKPGWVLVRLRTIQPSVTEVQWAQGQFVSAGSPVETLLTEEVPRQMFGHEFCGDVVEAGDGVHHVGVGDRVIYWQRAACYECALCRAGRSALCRKGPILGVDIPGCLAEYVLLPGESVTSIPDSLTDSEGAAMQPLAGAVADVHGVGIEMGDTVVVLGQGVMGLNIMQLARCCGAAKTIAVDVRDDVLALSGDLGADLVINARGTDPVEEVIDATGGLGADAVFECAGGSPQQGLAGSTTLTQAVRMVRDQGRIMQVGMLEPSATLPAAPVGLRGIQYRGQINCTRQLINYAMQLVGSGRVQLAPLISQVLEGIEEVPRAFEMTGNKAQHGLINPAQVVVWR
jgi:threonine dehydrogenase-like Zn-dependent dehydrogenase